MVVFYGNQCLGAHKNDRFNLGCFFLFCHEIHNSEYFFKKVRVFITAHILFTIHISCSVGCFLESSVVLNHKRSK